MSSSHRPAGPARPQNEQRDAVAEQEGLDDLAAQQVPVDDGDEADTDEFAVADAIGEGTPDGEDAPRAAEVADADRQARPAEPDARTRHGSGDQRSPG